MTAPGALPSLRRLSSPPEVDLPAARRKSAKEPATGPAAALEQEFRDYLSREGLKGTRQRELIVRTFAGREDHVSVDDLLELVRRDEPNIGYATVYRTLKLLVDAGLASERHFGDGFTRFEPRDEEHHDHMICTKCGKIVEFHDEAIERRQDEVAEQHGFVLSRHRHELYGHCEDCR